MSVLPDVLCARQVLLSDDTLPRGWLPLCIPRPSHSDLLVFQCIVGSRVQMRSSSPAKEKRQQNRVPAVLPVRVRGTDRDGKPFEQVAHTLDIAATGARLAAIHRPLRVLDQLIVVYRQRRMAFLIVWTKLIGNHEYQVGLQAVDQGNEAWGLVPSDCKSGPSRPVR